MNNDAEGAEESNIGKTDDLFETESETSNKEAGNYKCFFSVKKCKLIIQN